MPDIVYVILSIGVSGGLMTMARRFRNPDKDAGLGIAGWSMFAIVLCIIFC